MRRKSGRLFVVSSPSGGGKTTVVEGLLRREPGAVRSVSVTTRPRRPSERHGVDYRFVSPAAFAKLRARRRLLEQARVHGAWYGTPRRAVERTLARGRDVVLCLDVQGARQIRRRFGRRAVLIFVLPPSLAALRARLAKRRTETPAQMRRRLAAARRELACARWYDYAVVNRRVREAIEQLRAILLAERARVR
ncbi:MAG: guanylate kinase [Candidatus Omnitrophica bacterium]|nr:guanylate kinase [Candidatus Omnitrophota bacterium]